MKIYFIRHLKTLGNYQKKYIGSTDESLYMPENQSLITIPNIKTFTSPMARCTQTCQLLGLQKYTQISNLRETDFGEIEGKTYEDLKDDMHYRNYIDGTEELFEGENRAEFKQRCINAFWEITEKSQSEECIAIVCHGGTIMAIMENLEILQKGFYGYQVKNGSGYLCQFDGEKLEILEELQC